jgi:hypothetical protein
MLSPVMAQCSELLHRLVERIRGSLLTSLAVLRCCVVTECNGAPDHFHSCHGCLALAPLFSPNKHSALLPHFLLTLIAKAIQACQLNWVTYSVHTADHTNYETL